MLERLFQLTHYRTDARTEIVAGVTTFMTMAYIIAVNPSILAGSAAHPGPLGPGLFAATVAATCLAALVPTLLMGVVSNYPFALASGMGLNAALVAAVDPAHGVTWQVMMGVVFVEGVIITLLVVTKLREAVMDAIPLDLKRAIGVGIGLFIALLGLHSGHLMGSNGPNGAPLASPPIGGFHDPHTLLTVFGLLLTALLMARGTRGALLLGIVGTTVLALVLHIAPLPARVVALPEFTTLGKMDIMGALKPTLYATIFAFIISDFFDTMGTVIAVGEQAGHLTPEGKLPRLNRVLLVDALAAVWGGATSASSVTAYVESASGVGEGGRTGLTAVTVALLFGAAMFFWPLVEIIPPEATAPALIIVGFLMMRVVKDIDFKDYTIALPAFLILLLVPLTTSIARGIGIGFIAFMLLRLLTGRAREVSPVMWFLGAAFLLSFYLERAAS